MARTRGREGPWRTGAGVGAVALLAMLCLMPAAWAGTYVDAGNTSGVENGQSWATAYTDLQAALATASSGDEIWVAAGAYKPTDGEDRTVAFVMKSGVGLYGGFAGNETARSQRDVETNVTILSGDIGDSGDATDNSYHVLIGASNAILDGFTITGGNANGAVYHARGGGLICYATTKYSLDPTYGEPGGKPGEATYGVSPTITDCIFTGNAAIEGGAVYAWDDALPAFTDCVFESNTATRGGTGLFRVTANATFTGCTFYANAATQRGGALHIDYGADVVLTSCLFSRNRSEGHGGAVYIDDTASQVGHTSPEFKSCTFSDNQATARGGAIAVYNKATPWIDGGSFSSNTAGTGGDNIAADYGVTVYLTNLSLSTGLDAGDSSKFSSTTPTTASANPDDNTDGDDSMVSIDMIAAPQTSPMDDEDGNLLPPPTDENGNPLPPPPPPLDEDGNPLPPPPPPGRDDEAEEEPFDSRRSDTGGNRARQGERGGGGRYRAMASAGGGTSTGLKTATFTPTGSARVYVDDDAAAGGDGASWATAYNDLQTALAAVQAAGGGEVWVAAGTYRPGTARADAFELASGVALYGGFAGTEVEASQRDWRANPTILSGDIGLGGDVSDNVYHVLIGADNALIDGFYVEDGYAFPEPGAGGPPEGGGAQHTTPEAIIAAGINDVTGGGMINFQTSPVVIDCHFRDCYAMKGGAVYNVGDFQDPSAVAASFEGCVFESCGSGGMVENQRGGGMSNDLSANPTLRRCVFVGNTTAWKGGGMYNDFGCSPELTNCLFYANTAVRGGAMANDGGSCPPITNCTFYLNTAEDTGAALYCGSYGSFPNRPVVSNSILWNNTTPYGDDEVYGWHESYVVIVDSVVTGGANGGIGSDPLFMVPDAPAGPDGLWGTVDDGLYPAAGGPCVDQGTDASLPSEATTDLVGQARISGAAVDLGAYEMQEETIDDPEDEPDGDPVPSFGASALLALAALVLGIATARLPKPRGP